MQIRSKFWLEDESGETVFGDGRRKMLELIHELGSMQGAAKSLGMSYRGVWARIKATEERLGVKLLETSVGRGKDRGSRLTPEAEKLIANFKLLTKKGVSDADQLFSEIFSEEDPKQKTVTPTVAVVGMAGSGKSDLIARLVSHWKEIGVKVGVIQLSNEKDEEKPCSQTLHKAGAMNVIFSESSRMVIDLPEGTNLTAETIAANYALGCDLVLVESRERLHLPTLELFRRDLNDSLLTRKRKYLLAVVGDRPGDGKEYPFFELTDLAGVAELVGQKILGDTNELVLLTVNGRKVPMLTFVQDIFEKAITGMVSSLKSCESPLEIQMTIRRNKR